MEKELRWKSHERQYTLTDSAFTKSELPEEELPISQATQQKVYPRWSRERLQNEAATLKFIASRTSIPVPKFLGLYEENGLLHLKTERAAGIPLDDLASDTATKHVADCLVSSILPQLRQLRHHTTGSIDATLPLIPPSRITCNDKRPSWSRKRSRNTDFVFCHNDLGQHNIFVDPDTFKITAIIDWEFAGYFTEEFEYPLWETSYKDRGQIYLQTDRLISFLDDAGESTTAASTKASYTDYKRFGASR
ncbi:kinase-like protein [Lizonia empirigonia]|nr:kinase-like protein [Lizonia empirigonia]